MTDMIETIKWLRDRTEIENLATLFGRGIDISSSYFDRCLHEDVEMEFPFGNWKGLAEAKRIRDTSIATACKFTYHHITNSIIEVEGDAGHGEFYGIAAHGKTLADGGTKIIYGGVIYTMDMLRTAAGWRIKRLQGEVTWIDDEGGLMQAIGGLVHTKTA